ncbi:MAG: DNA polymerase III subunit delta [Pyrinomonadaceae bacterium]
MNREKLREQLRQGKLTPVYTLFGEESYLRDAAVKYIADLCFSEGELREFNEDEYSLNTAENLKSALAAAEQLPMMAKRRVIRVTDVRVAATSNRDTLKEEFEPALAAYIQNPCASSVLIFVADELSGNRKLGKLLKDKTTAVEFARLDRAGLRKWAADHLRGLGADADAGTISHLVDMAGDDVRRLSNEAGKLAAAALPDGKITHELVDSLVPFSRELSNFGLTDNLLAGRKADALRTLKRILDNGTEPLALLGLISSNYRRLLIASEMLSRGEPRGNVVSAAKIFSSGQDAFLAAARRIETTKLARALQRISQADLAIKTSVGGSGPIGSRLQMEMLVCELALL